MKKSFAALLCFFSLNSHAQKNQSVITDDIKNFWWVYSQVIKMTDSMQRVQLVQRDYIDKGTPGLAGIIHARRYTAAEYVKVIDQYPLFWTSIKQNTLKANSYADKIEKGINKLRNIYPDLKPAKVYFTIGAFRTGGTTIDDKVLIGSEIAMADRKTVTSEFGKNLSHLPGFFASNPIKGITFLNVHEYIHTQQKTTIGNSLLAQTIIEGVAEFIATKALNTASPNEQITFGKANDSSIKNAYTKEMFSNSFDNWIWNSADNEFKMRDLGYYVGYAICEKYYSLAPDKKQAIKTMIELDYNDEATLISFVEGTHYFEKTLAVYKEALEKSRPTLVRIEPFTNGQQDVDASIIKVTLHFSEPMNKKRADFDIGPLGDQNVMWLQKRIGFSEDGRSYSFEIRPLVPGKHHQLLVSDFMNTAGIPLKPYLIDVSTAK